MFVAQPSAHFLQVCVYYKDGKEKKLTSVKYREKYKKVNVTCRLFLWKNVWEDKPQPKNPKKPTVSSLKVLLLSGCRKEVNLPFLHSSTFFFP